MSRRIYSIEEARRQCMESSEDESFESGESNIDDSDVDPDFHIDLRHGDDLNLPRDARDILSI